MSNLISKNVVVEARFPKAGEIMSVLDKEVNEYLVRAKDGLSPENEETKHKERMKVSQRLTDQWNQIVRAYNERGDTAVPILEIYQRLRGVYNPNEQKNQLTKIRPFGYTLMIIVLLFSLGAGIWVALKRNKRVVRASQPEFLALICMGTLIMGTSIASMSVDDSIASKRGCDIACMATPWLVAIGFAVCFSSLFSKIWRLNTLMKSAASFRRIKVSINDVLLPFGIIFTLNVVFLSVWTAVDPLYWERVDRGRNENGDIESYGRCTSAGTTSIVMLSLLAGVNALALVLANFQAYQARKISVAYNESKFIALSMASILQAVLIGMPLLFLSNTNPTASYVIRSLLIFVVCMSVLCFIFIPKMIRDRKPEDSSSRTSGMLSMHDMRQYNKSFSKSAINVSRNSLGSRQSSGPEEK